MRIRNRRSAICPIQVVAKRQWNDEPGEIAPLARQQMRHLLRQLRNPFCTITMGKARQ